MLRPYSDLERLTLRAIDGEIGSIKDVYFDDNRWTMRYLVVATGEWFTGRRVLIAPESIERVDWSDQRLDLQLTRDQIRNSPGVDADKPVSRQQEAALFDYYGHPYYWTSPMFLGVGGMGLGAPITPTIAERDVARREREAREQSDPHLRSASEVSGYGVEATDGSIGHVQNFLFDDADWSLRYFVLDTRNWLPGRKVIVARDWVDEVNWAERRVHVKMLKEEVRNSPEYDHDALTEEAEDALHRHYGRQRSTSSPNLS